MENKLVALCVRYRVMGIWIKVLYLAMENSTITVELSLEQIKSLPTIEQPCTELSSLWVDNNGDFIELIIE